METTKLNRRTWVFAVSFAVLGALSVMPRAAFSDDGSNCTVGDDYGNASFEVWDTHDPGAPVCREFKDMEFIKMMHQRLDKTIKLVHCSDLKGALNEVREFEAALNAEIERGDTSVSERGFCYEKKDCKGSLVVRTIVTKDACKAADGKSWKMTAPRAGSCLNY